MLIACLITLIAPVIGAVVGSAGTLVGTAVGALAGQEAAAFLRALCLLLIRESQVILKTLLVFLGKFTRGNVEQMLRAIKFTAYEKQLLEYLNTFLTKTLDAVRKLRSYLNRWPFNQATQLLARLQEMEKQFYAVQLHAVREIPLALAELDARLAKALEQAVKEPSQVATSGIRAEKPVPMAMNGGRITSGVGMPPIYLERPPGTYGTPTPIAPQPVPHGPNVHAFDPKTATTAQKGIYGEVISDQYMLGKGHENLLSSSRGPRSMDMMPTGRGIDGVYKNANPPPPYIITETKYRTGGEFPASKLPTTKGSAGYPSAKQMSDEWIDPRLKDVVDKQTLLNIRRDGYERWLLVVDESGNVTSITRLDENANAIGKIAK